MQYIDLTRSELIVKSLQTEVVTLSEGGALCVNTGKHTGRSANDKFIVCDSQAIDVIDWSANNLFEPSQFNSLYGKVNAYLQGKDTYVQNLHAGTNVKLKFKLTTTSPRHAAFSTNMFYIDDCTDPQFELIHVPDFYADPKVDGTNSEAFIVISFGDRKIIIGGTHYSGEIKKSVFTAMNFILPQLGILPMHAAVNSNLLGEDSCIFFGLSGTGKTTLSADMNRTLIGDDEHGWAERSVFNFENGCYAKTLNLSKEREPQIWQAVNKFGSILENVVINNGIIDFNNNTFTDNTRGSYKLDDIENSNHRRSASIPKHIIMLTYDNFGVLPAVSKLSINQACYHFLSGFTSKVSGTEGDIKEPVSTFSACFGAPFLPLPPLHYVEMLFNKIKTLNIPVYLVNTGLQGGGYGQGQRIALDYTREIVSNIVNGTYDDSDTVICEPLGLTVPIHNPLPQLSWSNTTEYHTAAVGLIAKFKDNFSKYKNVPQYIKDGEL